MFSSAQLKKIQYILLNIQPDTIRQKLISIGAECVVPLRRIQRFVLKIPRTENGHIRLQYDNNRIKTCFIPAEDSWWEKIDVYIDNIELMRKIYLKCGLAEKSIQEFYRESWRFHDFDLFIERWPWLHPFLKLSWTNAEKIENLLELIGSHISNVLFEATTPDVYKRELWIDRFYCENIPIITFDCPPISEKK